VAFEEFCRNIEAFSEYWIVRLSGGEPFYHPDIAKMVDFMHDKWIKIEILSSWTIDKKPLSREMLKPLAGKVDNIVFSMHGYYEDYHKIVNPNFEFWHPYWDDMMDSVEQCADLWIPFSFQAVIMKENVGKIEEIVKNVSLLNCLYADKISSGKLPKIGLHFLRYINQWRWKENMVESPDKWIMELLPMRFKSLEVNYWTRITFSSNFEFKDCDCTNKKMVICADGNVIPCSALKWAEKDSAKRFACVPRL
jgi:MoaA/NifB/PqqE/SkfB family radical SAM enzyme